jgi:hypothetical protein
MARLLGIAVIAWTGVISSESLAKYTRMMAKECEEQLDECARKCDSLNKPKGRPLCIDGCNSEYNHCFAISKPDRHDLQNAPAVTGEKLRKPRNRGTWRARSAPIKRLSRPRTRQEI